MSDLSSQQKEKDRSDSSEGIKTWGKKIEITKLGLNKTLSAS